MTRNISRNIMTEICAICCGSRTSLLSVVGDHDERNLAFGDQISSVEILSKLKYFVPEVEWNATFQICDNCIQNINEAYNFKILCLKSWEYHIEYRTCTAPEPEKITSSESNENDGIDNFTDSVDEESECYRCITCENIFTTKLELEKHVKNQHQSINVDRWQTACENCGKFYRTKKAVKRHMLECNKNNTVISNLNSGCSKLKPEFRECEVDCSSEDNQHPTAADELLWNIPPTCTLCGVIFGNKYLLRRHSRNVHATTKNFRCELCDKTFVSSGYLEAHKRYHERDRAHICSFCGKGFITSSDRYHHEKIHGNKRSYRCEICPKAFNTSSDLHKHKVCVHSDKSLWKYKCTICEKQFPLKTNLDYHIKAHTGEKSHPCHLCERKCISKSVLMRHIRTHSNVITFTCTVCAQGYKYKKSLDLHLAKVHGMGIVKIPEKLKNYICPLCPKSFYANYKLQKHIRSHSGERPFTCPHCNKSFVDKSYVKQHLKTAHNVEENKEEFQ